MPSSSPGSRQGKQHSSQSQADPVRIPACAMVARLPRDVPNPPPAPLSWALEKPTDNWRACRWPARPTCRLPCPALDSRGLICSQHIPGLPGFWLASAAGKAAGARTHKDGAAPLLSRLLSEGCRTLPLWLLLPTGILSPEASPASSLQPFGGAWGTPPWLVVSRPVAHTSQTSPLLNSA